jgi:DNA-binding NtrC family response regulator
MSAQVLIYEPEANRNCPGNCSRIKSIVQDALGLPAPSVKAFHQLKGLCRESEPDVLVLLAPIRRPLMDVLRPLRELWRSVHVVAAVCSVPQCSADLQHSLKHGLDDFFCCPFLEIDFLSRIRRWLPEPGSRSAPRLALSPKLDILVGESPSFLRAISRIPQVAASAAAVLIGGETGVGKELFARAVHYSGERKNRPFIPVNSSTLPDHLFENELFGHAKGAYTDAGSPERGLLGEAEGGTIFLDEVDMLSPSAQAKLLRFLQDREYRPLGSSKTLISDARVIAASNSDLRELVARRVFREDLFYRLNVLSLHVPPLRDRMDDIPLLATHFLRRFAAQYGRGAIHYASAALRKMLAYSWPGNVRELEGLLHRAVVFGTSDLLKAEDIELPDTAVEVKVSGGAKDHAMEEFERGYLMSLLAEHHGNVSHAARAAGKDRRTLQRLLRKHAIPRMVFAAAGG